MQNDGQWYWSLTKHCAVPAGQEKNDDVLGPYASREEAERALEKVQVRNAQWMDSEERDMTPDEIEEFRDREKFGGMFGL